MGGCFSSAEPTGEQPQIKYQQNQQKPEKQQSKVSPIYPNLPKGAQKHKVRNVYDGDTLTLIDERRVRFLGIDTPELKEKQAFAEEAKQHTKKFCHRKDIWISFEGDQKDHYGRLLAFIWVPAIDNGRQTGYLNVNESLVSEGFATTYFVRGKKLATQNKLILLQKEARKARRGMWSIFQDYDVVTTVNGSAFHRRGCKHIEKIRNLKQMKASLAMDNGLHPCRKCLADK